MSDRERVALLALSAAAAYYCLWPRLKKWRLHRINRVLIFGPPGSGKTTLVPLILDGRPMKHVRPGKLFAQERSKGTEFGKALDLFYAEASDGGVAKPGVPPTQLFLPFLQRVMQEIEASGRGWLLEKGPRVAEQFSEWRDAGIFPDKIIVLTCDPEVIVKRTRGRRHDPVTGESYNVEGHMPSDPQILARLETRPDDVDVATVRTRIARFETKYAPVMDLYKACPGVDIRRFSTTGTPREIAAEINAFIDDTGKDGSDDNPQAAEVRRLQRNLVRALEGQQSRCGPWQATEIADALQSLKGAPMKLMVPKGGTTGSRFLRTADLRFLVKSLRTSKSCNEPYFLDLIFPDLASHFESVKGQSLLPRMPMGAVRTAPYASLGGHDAWCILRNVNGYEVERGVSDEGDTIAVDVKGFSQLYQHSIGGDFYRIQDPTALELTSALQATAAELSIMSGVNATAQRPSEVREALEADLRFLAAHSLVDYSLLIIRHPHPKLLERWRGGSIATAMIAGAGVQMMYPSASMTTASIYGAMAGAGLGFVTGGGMMSNAIGSSKRLAFTKYGASMLATDGTHSYSLGLIDILSHLSGERIKTSHARGLRYGLPCGKFEDYAEQMRDMLELLSDRSFGLKCIKTLNAVAQKLPELKGRAHVPTRTIVRGQKKAHEAALKLEDLVAARLIGRYCADMLQSDQEQRDLHFMGAELTPESLMSTNSQRIMSALSKPCAAAPHAPLSSLLEESLLPAEEVERLNSFLEMEEKDGGAAVACRVSRYRQARARAKLVVTLVRHAESANNADKTTRNADPPLTAKGVKQAQLVGKALAADIQKAHAASSSDVAALWGPQRVEVWTSPFLRTCQTTDQIIQQFGSGIKRRVLLKRDLHEMHGPMEKSNGKGMKKTLARIESLGTTSVAPVRTWAEVIEAHRTETDAYELGSGVSDTSARWYDKEHVESEEAAQKRADRIAAELVSLASADAVADPAISEDEPPRQLVIVSHALFLSKLLHSLTGHNGAMYNASLTRFEFGPGWQHMEYSNSVTHLAMAGDPGMLPKGVGGGLV